MSEEQNEEVADALNRLAAGETGDAETPAAPSESVPLEPSPAANPPPHIAPKSIRPPAPGSGKADIKASAVPPPRFVASKPKERPAAPVQQPVPKERPAAPSRSEAPVSPAALPGEAMELSSALANVVEDSDDVVAPAPDLSTLARAKPRIVKKRVPYMRSLQFRQTIIPVLLVLGVSLPGLAIYWLTLNRDSLIRSAGPALPIVLVCVGLVMLALAIVNMLAVKDELASR